MPNTVIQARVDETAKREAESILNELGISLSDGIRMFISQVRVSRGLPFRPSLAERPNPSLTRALNRAEQYLAGDTADFNRFGSVDDALADLMKDGE